jgi:threonine dehydrogenase-like Zn-dependent dehydrogenase
VRVDDVANPVIVNPRDVILKITSTAVSGAYLHFYNGLMLMVGWRNPPVKRGISRKTEL